MWQCRKCRERLEDQFDTCWNCGTAKNEGEAEAVDVTVVESARTIDQLIFVGLNGYALALDRDTGAIVWANDKMQSGYVTLLLDGDRLIVSTNGYMYCLDPLTGDVRWHNPLSGYGFGAPTSITSVRGQHPATLIQQAADATSRNSHG